MGYKWGTDLTAILDISTNFDYHAFDALVLSRLIDLEGGASVNPVSFFGLLVVGSRLALSAQR